MRAERQSHTIPVAAIIAPQRPGGLIDPSILGEICQPTRVLFGSFQQRLRGFETVPIPRK